MRVEDMMLKDVASMKYIRKIAARRVLYKTQ
jgi:hypothetical protein